MNKIMHYYNGKYVNITDLIILKPPCDTHKHIEGSGCSKCNPQLFMSDRSGALSSYLLSQKLLAAKKAYYETGTSKMSDDEYDAMESSLRAINPTAEILNKVGS